MPSDNDICYIWRLIAIQIDDHAFEIQIYSNTLSCKFQQALIPHYDCKLGDVQGNLFLFKKPS